MTLTFSQAPLSTSRRTEVNYDLQGPEHLLLFDVFPRRVRAVFGGETVLDTDRGRLLHESSHLPVLYVRDSDVRDDLLRQTEHTTYCPFKGDAAYWSVVAGGSAREDRVAENAVWAYPDPIEQASWLRGYKAFYPAAMDEWWDEDEQVQALRDPYHRVDSRHTKRRVRVLHGADVLADSDLAVVLSETGLPNRYYLPADDVDWQRLEASEMTAHCPYKGDAAYWSLTPSDGSDPVADVAWSYREPFENALKTKGHLCFLHDDLVTEVDGEQVG